MCLDNWQSHITIGLTSSFPLFKAGSHRTGCSGHCGVFCICRGADSTVFLDNLFQCSSVFQFAPIASCPIYGALVRRICLHILYYLHQLFTHTNEIPFSSPVWTIYLSAYSHRRDVQLWAWPSRCVSPGLWLFYLNCLIPQGSGVAVEVEHL